MKRGLMVAVVLLVAATAQAEIRVQHGLGPSLPAPVYVRPYVTYTGNYVGGHYRSAPDGNFYNNWSTYPNYNPYTGQQGYRLTPYQPYRSYYYAPYRW
jgi:hypothetical protein